MKGHDVSIVVNGHREGLMMLPSLRSAASCARHASSIGIQCEIIVVLDRPDDTTRYIGEKIHGLHENSSVICVDFGDLGKSRNHGIKLATGRFIAFLDGDDLWSKNWISEAFLKSIQDSRPTVLHPDFNIYFGYDQRIFSHVSMDDDDFSKHSVVISNPWTALCFVSRDIALEHPYPGTDLSKHLGFEDWGWNMKTMSVGVLHLTVPDTFHAIRNKEISLVRQTIAAGCFPAHTPSLFQS